MLCYDSQIYPLSKVGYLPIVDASPTEYSTLNEVLKSGIRILDKLQLQQTVFVFDEGLYSKIQHIRWKEQVFYDRFVVRLGEFHACAFCPLYLSFLEMEDLRYCLDTVQELQFNNKNYI